MAISTRFRAPSLVMRLARWVLTALRPMWSSSAISALVRPAGHRDDDLLLAVGEGLDGLGLWRPRAGFGERGQMSDGDARGDERVAVGSGADRLEQQVGAGVLEQEAPAPALRAPCTYSSRSQVVITTIASGSSTSGPASCRCEAVLLVVPVGRCVEILNDDDDVVDGQHLAR
jgi:hypothetical protein